MKTREARRVFKTLASGKVLPQHVIHAACRQIKTPAIISTYVGELFYFPNCVEGEFHIVSDFSGDRGCKYVTNKPPVASRDVFVSKLKKEGLVFLDLCAGSDIHDTFDCAAETAQALNLPIPFNHNGTPYVVKGTDDPDVLRAEWDNRGMTESYLAKLKEEAKKRQEKMDGLLKVLPTILDNLHALIEWIGHYINLSRISRVESPINCYEDKVFEILSTVFVANQYYVAPSNPPKYRREMENHIHTNKTMFARFIGGQFLVALKDSHYRRHHIEYHISDYKKLMRPLILQDGEITVNESGVKIKRLPDFEGIARNLGDFFYEMPIDVLVIRCGKIQMDGEPVDCVFAHLSRNGRTNLNSFRVVYYHEGKWICDKGIINDSPPPDTLLVKNEISKIIGTECP